MKKILTAILALLVVLGLQGPGLVNAHELDNLPDGTYEVPTKLKNAGNIANDSMAAGALVETGVLSVEDGNWYLIAEFKTLEVFGLKGNASDIKYYETDLQSAKHDAEIISYRQDSEGKQQVEKIKFPVATNSQGAYINIFVDAMAMNVDAYIAYTTDEIVVPQPEIAVVDGLYTAPVTVLKSNSDEISMAAQAVKNAQIEAKNNKLVITLTMAGVTVANQTAYIDKFEYEVSDGKYEAAKITKHDSEGHVREVQFTLPRNTLLTNVKFYYLGSQNGSSARLSLDLNNLTPIKTIEESKFNADGTYEVKVSLWHASNDQPSMANKAIEEVATIVVKNGQKTMYLKTKEMTLGTIKASLQELYIGSLTSNYKANPAKVETRDQNNNPTLWSFTLPNEEELFDVVVNPRVAIMGNADIGARIKVDYNSLKFISNAVVVPEGNKVTASSTEKKTAVKTGDQANVVLMGGLLIASLLLLGISRKKSWQ